jgi:Homeodomain-like domain-containing protein
MAIGFGCLDQSLDFIGGQVLPCPKVSVLGSARRDCSILVVGATRRRRGVPALKKSKETGEGARKIAKRFGINPSTVQRISHPFDGRPRPHEA